MIALVALYFIWGSTYLAMRWAVAELPPLLMASTRFLCAGALLMGFLRLRGAQLPSLRQWLYALPVGGLLFTIGNGLVAISETSIASGVAAVVCATSPLCAAVLVRFFGERTSAREWLGLLLGFAGVVVLSLGSGLRADPAMALLLCLAPMGWALGSILGRRLPMPGGMMAAAVQMIAGGAVTLLVALTIGERIPTNISMSSVAALGYLIVAGSLIAFSCYSYLLRSTRLSIAMSYAYVNPVFAVLLGALLGGEAVGLETLAAMSLITIAVATLMRARARSR